MAFWPGDLYKDHEPIGLIQSLSQTIPEWLTSDEFNTAPVWSLWLKGIFWAVSLPWNEKWQRKIK